MKILNLFILFSVLTGASACLKKDNYNTDVKVLSVKPIIKIKTARELTVTPTSTSISNYVYNYDTDKRVESVNQIDSAGNGVAWVVNSSTLHYQYTSFGRWFRSVRVTGMPETLTTMYVYDSNHKLRNEIQVYGTDQDTIEYIHSGNTCMSQPKYPGASYTKVFYTDGDPDSTISYLNNAVTQKSYYSYTGKIDQSYAYFISVLPLNPTFKEVNSVVVNGAINKVYSYSYAYDDKDFATKKVIASPGETITTTYTYISD